MKNFYKYFFYFIVFSFLGYLFEMLWHLYQYGSIINVGTMIGPWLPIYGSGALIIYFLTKRFKNKPILFFIISFLISAVIEYATSFYLEKVYNKYWWDYSNMPFNINGRVFLYGLLAFAFVSMIGIYLIIPLLDKIIDKVNIKRFKMVMIILFSLFIIDFIYSTFNPNSQDAGNYQSKNISYQLLS